MNVKRNSIINKICAIWVIFALTISNFLFVGKTAISYAIAVTKTNNENVTFSTYFINANGEKVERIERNIDQGEEYLYVDISVKNDGYFQGTIHLADSNFNIKQEKLSQEIDEISKNDIKLKQINAGSNVTIKLAIEAPTDEKIKQDILSKKTNIELEGKYINSKNVEKAKYISIKGTSSVELAWKSSEESKAELDAKLLTNATYKVDDAEKKVVQILVSSKLNNNNYPVKNTEINVSLPKNVQDVKVRARDLSGTNNEDNIKESDYVYDKESGKLNIKLANENINNINWKKNAEDLIVVTLEFNKEETISSKNVIVKSTLTTYDNKTLSASKTVNIAEEKDGAVSSDLNITESEIYKGKIYTGEERNYTVNNKINIDYLVSNQNIVIDQNEAVYLQNKQEKNANIIFKESKINKAEFLKIFGENGYITIKGQNGSVIANINKNSEADENGNILVSYIEENKSIKIETSSPIKVGTLNIEHTKSIMNANYSREEIQLLTGIEEKVVLNGNEENKVITLKETETLVDTKIDTQDISTTTDKQIVTIETTLQANDESNDLYKNPSFTITFPKEISVKSAQYAVLYKNGLNVDYVNVQKNNNGIYQINAKLSGEQTKYETTGGTKILLKVEIETDKLTPSKESSIEVKYKNENKNISNTKNIPINFESQYGLMIYNKMTNFNNANEEIVTVDQEKASGSIDVNSSKKDAILNTVLINNFGDEISNVVLVGNIPSGESEENYAVNLGKIDIPNAKIYYSNKKDANANDASWGEYIENAKSYKIVINKMQKEEIVNINIPFTIPENIKYNKKGEFSSNTTCVYNGKEQTNSSIIALSTKANMTEETSAVETNKETESGLNTKVSAFVGNDSLNENDNVYEGQTIRYQVTITNNTGKDYTNINVKASQKNGYFWDYVETDVYNPNDQTSSKEHYYEPTSSNTKEFTTNIESLKNGESYTFEYESEIYMLNNEHIDGTETYGTISILTADKSIDDTITTIKNNIKSAELQVKLIHGYSKEMELTSGGDIKSAVSIKNVTNSKLENINLSVAFSSNLIASVSIDENNEAKVSYVNEEKKDGITIRNLKISSIEAGENILIELYPYTNDFSEDKQHIWVLAEAVTENQNSYISNKLTRQITNNTADIKVEQQTQHEDGKQIDIEAEKISDGEKIKILATISNNDTKNVNVDIDYAFDSMIDIESAKITSSTESDKDVMENILNNNLSAEEQEIKPGENIKINIEGTVDALDVDKVTSTLSVYDKDTGKSSISTLSMNVNKESDNLDEPASDKEPDNNNNTSDNNANNGDNGDNNNNNSNNSNQNNSDNNNNNNDDNQKNYSITGIAWIDKDKDGKKNSSEEIMPGIEVNAMNSETGEIVATSRTDESGTYKFNLPEGKYILVFFYDNNLYTVTTYQVKNASAKESSDVITSKMTINGSEQTVASTDVIDLSSDKTNVNIGLILRNTFDLKVKKYVSKITVTNDDKTKTYEQKDNTTLAKAEIKSKNLNGSLVVIEYKIQIKNEGDVAGYARNVVDYMPSSLSFNSSMNPEWYLSGNNLYNTSLANTKIEAGETKELTLVLTKTMTDSNTGLINNRAEITESSNDLGIKDESDDKGSADVIISVSTGALVSYVATTVITLVVLAGLAYLVNKKYLSKKI